MYLLRHLFRHSSGNSQALLLDLPLGVSPEASEEVVRNYSDFCTGILLEIVQEFLQVVSAVITPKFIP